MDNATHSLVGLFLSRAGLNRFTPAATGILILAANAPDIDLVTLAGGPLNYFHCHRHITHSLFAAPILTALIVLIFRFASGPIAWLPAMLVGLTGVLSHLLLDLTNTYGVKILLPFSGRWVHWDLVGVIDFWIWTILFVCVAGPFLSKLVSSEIGGGSRRRYPGRGFAWLALMLLVAYDGGRWILHSRAIATLDAREYEGAAPLRTAAFPVSENPLHWKGVAETEKSYRLFDLMLTGEFDPSAANFILKPERSPAIDAAERSEPFRIFSDFAQYPVWRQIPVPEPEGATRVELSDLRFGFASTALVDRQSKLLSSSFSFSGPGQKR